MRGRFTRGGEVLSYEIHRDPAFGPYQMRITHPDGTQTSEEIPHASDLIDHVAALMKRLRREGWTLDPT